MSNGEQEGLARLYADLVDDTLPPAELLARYATDPNGLEPEERRLVEAAMARSPAVMDELDTLRHFDFGALDADRESAGASEGLIARILGALRGRPELWAVAAAALALMLWLAWPGGPAEPPPSGEMIAEEPAPETPVVPEPAPEPESIAPRAHERAPLLAEDSGEQRPPAPEAPTPVEEQPAPQLAAEEPPRAPTPGPEGAEPAPQTAPAAEQEILLAMAMPVYQPAYGLDAPGLSDWTTRSAEVSDTHIALATPAHVTRTRSTHPTLFWSIDRVPETGAFHLSIVDAEDEPIVLDRELPRPGSAGLQRIDLGALGIELPEDRVLRWSVALRADEDAPPSAFDFGWLRVEPLDPALAARLAASPIQDRIAPLASAGCFHDALGAALETWRRHPDDPRARDAVVGLFEQAGLDAPDLPRSG